MKQRVFSHLRSRGPLLLGVLLLVTFGSCARPVAPANDRDGLAALLARATGQWVDASQLVWERSDGWLCDLLFGRRLFFLAATAKGSPRDLYQASIRLARLGQPLAVRLLRNITQTPLGDDSNLRGTEGHLVFTTTAYGAVQAVTVLDTRGADPADLPLGRFDRWLAALTAFQQTGHFAGLGQADIVLEQRTTKLRLDLNESRLTIEFPGDRPGLIFDLSRRTLGGADTTEPTGGRLSIRGHGTKPFVLWAVDTLREELGPAVVAWLQRSLFGARDRVERTAYSLVSSVRTVASDEPATVPLGAIQSLPAESWPPAAIASMWSQPEAGEGQWRPVETRAVKSQAPAFFYRTFLRPDRNRPYAQVILVAMDMRQLRLGMQAGYEDPKPMTGPPGSGRLPSDVVGKVVAVFNGAFKTSHGAYGMMADGRVLVPAVPHAASIVITQDGDAGFGDWPASSAPPSDIVSFRQNLDALVAGGAINPSGRSEWGERLAGDNVLTERTALCRTSAGHLYYAWGKELTADALARALQRAGCDYAVHLDMNPKQCGFAFVSYDAGANPRGHLELADGGMDINPERYVTYSPKDFFYLLPDDPTPPSSADVTWQISSGTQPEPTWAPAIFEAARRLGSLDVKLFTIDPGRVDWRLRAGSQESRAQGFRPSKVVLEPGEQQAILLATNLGNATAGTSYGMAFDGQASLPLSEDQATLIVPQSGDLRLLLPGDKVGLGKSESAVQLPLLAVSGKITERASARGSRTARAALCVKPTGAAIVATAENDSSDVLALALLAQGCSNIAELDRGSHHVAFVQRAGGTPPPSLNYEASVLFALERPMQPHTFRFTPQLPAAP